MDEQPRTAISARRYQQMMQNDGVPRFLAAVVLIPAAVILFVPGPWWWVTALILVVALAAEVGADFLTQRRLARLQYASSDKIGGIARILLLRSSVVASLYSVPNVVLAFAPGPGPWIGYAFAAAGMLRLLTLKTSSRAMASVSSPMLTASLVLNGLAVQGWIGFALAGAGLILNTIASSRAGVISLSELIERQIDLESAASMLERRVEERTIELRNTVLEAESARREAEDANKTKSLFLAKMSHELRTPLNAIIGYTEIVQEDLASINATQSDDDLAHVHSSASHLLKLINDVLEISALDAERLMLNDERVDNRTLVLDALAVIMPIASRNKTTCDFVISPDAETMQADSLRLKQCLGNLLSNAAKFTQEGRIILQVYATEHAGAPAIAFEVSDTGIGIAEHVQKELFQPFVQADNTFTRSYDGTGLGLAIARRLASLMGGDISLASELGKGSRFTLIVPRLRPQDRCIAAAA